VSSCKLSEQSLENFTISGRFAKNDISMYCLLVGRNGALLMYTVKPDASDIIFDTRFCVSLVSIFREQLTEMMWKEIQFW